jgi:hypothetical protein
MPVGSGYAPYIRASSFKEDLPIRVYGLPASGRFDAEYDAELELSYHPRLDYSALKSGDEFSLIEGVKVIGSGVILSEIFAKEVGATHKG